MRKYLLLATVAGCMASTCAFAGGSIATNKQSAVINVKANIQIATEVTSLQDMNFGTLYVLSGTTGDLAYLGTDGTVETENSGVVATKGSPAAGSISLTSAYPATVTCADGTGAPLSGDACSLGNNLVLKNLRLQGIGGCTYGICKEYKIGGMLSATEAVTQARNIDAPGIKVELQY